MAEEKPNKILEENTPKETPANENITEEEPVDDTENISEEIPTKENAIDRDLIVVPKKDDILFYYLKYEGGGSVDKLKLKVKVLEYPSGDSFRNVRAVVEEVIETTSTDKDEMKVGDEDIFDISDLDPKDMPIDEFIPRTVEELIAFSNSQAQDSSNDLDEKPNNAKDSEETPETNNNAKESEETPQTNNNAKESEETTNANNNAKESEEMPETKNNKPNNSAAAKGFAKPNEDKTPTEGGSRRRRTPRKVKSSKKNTRSKSRTKKTKA